MIESDKTLIRLNKGKAFEAPANGWFMSDALYRLYRQAVSDSILREEK